MRHEHIHSGRPDVNIKVEIPTEDVAYLIDHAASATKSVINQATESALMVVGALTVSYVFKQLSHDLIRKPVGYR